MRAKVFLFFPLIFSCLTLYTQVNHAFQTRFESLDITMLGLKKEEITDAFQYNYPPSDIDSIIYPLYSYDTIRSHYQISGINKYKRLRIKAKDADFEWDFKNNGFALRGKIVPLNDTVFNDFLIKIERYFTRLKDDVYYQEIDPLNRILVVVSYNDELKNVGGKVHFFMQGKAKTLRKYYKWKI